MLQNRIEQLEQLLEENHEIISHIKDSVLELTAHAEGQPALPRHPPNGSWALPPESRPSFLSVSPQDCQFALGGKGQSPDLQVKGWGLGAAVSTGGEGPSPVKERECAAGHLGYCLCSAGVSQSGACPPELALPLADAGRVLPAAL